MPWLQSDGYAHALHQTAANFLQRMIGIHFNTEAHAQSFASRGVSDSSTSR